MGGRALQVLPTCDYLTNLYRTSHVILVRYSCRIYFVKQKNKLFYIQNSLIHELNKVETHFYISGSPKSWNSNKKKISFLFWISDENKQWKHNIKKLLRYIANNWIYKHYVFKLVCVWGQNITRFDFLHSTFAYQHSLLLFR